jgi:hypothetical protein
MRKINKNKKENNRLSHPLPIHSGCISKKNIIQLWMRSNPNLEGINISIIKFGQPISTFVPFSQGMIKGDHPSKRSELSNK